MALDLRQDVLLRAWNLKLAARDRKKFRTSIDCQMRVQPYYSAAGLITSSMKLPEPVRSAAAFWTFSGVRAFTADS